MKILIFTSLIISTLIGCSFHLKSGSSTSNELLVLKNATIIDGTGSKAQRYSTIVIEHGRIVTMSNSNLDFDASVVNIIDLEGKYLIPGLIDGHVHLLDSPKKSATRKAERAITKMFKQGVTSVRDMAGSAKYLKELKQLAIHETVPMARVYYSTLVAGPEFMSSDPRVKNVELGDLEENPWVIVITDSTDIPQAISRSKKFGVDAIKLYEEVPGNLAINLIREAKKQGLQVWAHASVGPEGPAAVIEAHCLSHAQEILISDTVDVLADSVFRRELNSKATEQLLIKMKQNQVVFDVTLGVSIMPLLKYEDNEYALGRMVRGLIECLSLLTQKAYELGVPIGVGTDDTGEIADEMELLVTRGHIPELQVIKAATYNNALALGIEKNYGTIEVGKVGDIVVLNSNPLDDIRNVEDIKYVIKAGLVYSK